MIRKGPAYGGAFSIVFLSETLSPFFLSGKYPYFSFKILLFFPPGIYAKKFIIFWPYTRGEAPPFPLFC
jgi:hypothetical protein